MPRAYASTQPFRLVFRLVVVGLVFKVHAVLVV